MHCSARGHLQTCWGCTGSHHIIDKDTKEPRGVPLLTCLGLDTDTSTTVPGCIHPANMQNAQKMRYKTAEEWSEQQSYFHISALILWPNRSEPATEVDEKLLVGKAESFFKAQYTCFSSVFNVKFNTGGQVAPLIFTEMREDFYVLVSIRDWTWHLHFLSLVIPLYQVFLEGWEIYDLARHNRFIYYWKYLLLIPLSIVKTVRFDEDSSYWAFRDTRRIIAIVLVSATSFIPMKIYSSLCFKGNFCDPKLQQFHNISN